MNGFDKSAEMPNVTTISRTRRSTIVTDDGVPLAVETSGPRKAPVVVVFVHGYTMRMECWDAQKQYLQRVWGSDIQLVSYDQRGHGCSGEGHRDTFRVSQLGDDLEAVLRTLPAQSKVVLVGHSMGAMTILAWARRHPDQIGTTVVGTALLSTAAAKLQRSGIARLLGGPLVPTVQAAAWCVGPFADVVRGAVNPVVDTAVKYYAFGKNFSDDAISKRTAATIRSTKTRTMLGFLSALADHDETAALPLLGSIPTVVLCGADDKVTPFHHSLEIADHVPGAELVRVPGCGHMVIDENPTAVGAALDRLLSQAHGQDVHDRIHAVPN
ncbi:alpha/beta fold hydrolase [Rhodococcus sp. NPDC058521]|uniref:alpha/beta fold hydrolase n=1 Tax=Rhodococcus sp. NPDC058521 TaxID=3346536 RepID=UPI003658DA29